MNSLEKFKENFIKILGKLYGNIVNFYIQHYKISKETVSTFLRNFLPKYFMKILEKFCENYSVGFQKL